MDRRWLARILSRIAGGNRYSARAPELWRSAKVTHLRSDRLVDRLQDPFRHRLFEYVSRLVKLRRTSDALAVNDTDVIHVDFTEGKRVVVWQRGRKDSEALVVVVANFSDFGTSNPQNSAAEYLVSNWPPAPPGKRWREVTQDRGVPNDWIGREPIFPWEAKVYALV